MCIRDRSQAVQQGFQGLSNIGKIGLDYKKELLPLFQQKGAGFSSVGGRMVNNDVIAQNPTLYGQYQGQNVYLPDVFQGGMEFSSGLTANPNPIDYTPTLLQPNSRD